MIHCGLEPAFFASIESPIPAARRLVCVGRICEQKGQLLLMKAAQKLSARGAAFELVLVGDGEMRAEIEALIERYKLQDKVRITGRISSEQLHNEIYLREHSCCRALPRVFPWSSWKPWR